MLVEAEQLSRALAMQPPIWTAVPSRPAEPPKRWVRTVADEGVMRGAMRRGTPPPGFVDLVDDEVVAGLGGFAESGVEVGDEESGEGEEEEEPGQTVWVVVDSVFRWLCRGRRGRGRRRSR